jgi:DNA-binding NtrC family response regulator
VSRSFLVVAADAVIEALVGELVRFSGHRPRHARHDESAAAAIRKQPPFGVLLDASQSEAEVDAVVQAAHDRHVIIVYFASSMSSGELRTFAEQRRALWFALPNGPVVVGRVLTQAINTVATADRSVAPRA